MQKLQSMRRSSLLGLVCLVALASITISSSCDCNSGTTSRGSELRVTPTTVIFPITPIGQTAKQTVELSNKLVLPVEITKLSFSKATHSAFSILTKVSFPLILQEGEKKVIELSYKPEEDEGASGELIIESNARNSGPDGLIRIKLRSVSNFPSPKISCAPVLAFDATPIGQKNEKTCELSNLGTATWKIINVKFSEGAQREFSVTTNFPIVVEPNGPKVTIKIVYQPLDPGEDSAVLQLLSSANQSTGGAPGPKLGLRGQAAAPKIEAQPSSLIFPFTTDGKKTFQKLTIRSVGQADLAVTQAKFAPGSSPNFALAAGTSLPAIIPVGQQIEFTVVYQGSAKKREQGELLLFNGDPERSTLSVPLLSVADGCNLDVTPRNINFPARKTVTVTLLNQGNRSCLIRSIKMDPSSSKDYHMIPERWPSLSLAPNKTLEFFVEYRPSDASKDTGQIVIESDDPDEPKIVLSLKAPVKVEACQLSPNPFVMHFGRVPIGLAQQRRITFVNEGLKNCEITSLQLSQLAPPGSSSFRQVSSINLPLSLPPGARHVVDLLFSPSRSIWYEGVLKLQSNDPQRPKMEVKILGSSAPLCIRAVPDIGAFDDAKPGCSSRNQTISLYNLCNRPLVLSGASFQSGGQSPFKLSKQPKWPVTINRGQATQITLGYRPSAGKTDQDTLIIANNSDSLPKLKIPLQGKAVSAEQQSDTFTQRASPKADILFVIDDSFSMKKWQSLLSQNLSSFLQSAQKQKVDYQIAVTTTTVRTNPLLQRAGGCFVGKGTRMITPKTPQPLSKLQQLVQVGTGGEAVEQGLEAAFRALTPPLIYDPNCNLGFLRKDASLSLVFLSDEPDQSPQPAAFYNQFFEALRGPLRSRIVRISALTAPMPKAACGTATTKGRYWNLAQKLGGVTASICSTDWKASMAKIGSLSFGLQRQFFLLRPATASSIKVFVNGKLAAKAAYAFDPKSNSISFTASATPLPNQKIEVKYAAQCNPCSLHDLLRCLCKQAQPCPS